jgi:STE24 endopeptidase
MNRRVARLAGFLALALFASTVVTVAAPTNGSAGVAETNRTNEMPSVTTVPEAARPSDHFDATAATNAYLAQIPAAARTRSDSYFVGGYWMILWDFLLAAVMYWVLLRWRISAGLRNLAEHTTRFRPLQTFLCWAQFAALTTVIVLPLAAYEGFFREWKYGLATQTLGSWFGDQVKGLLIAIVMGGVLAMLLFGVVRKFPRTWHVWGAIVTMAFVIFAVMIAPVVLIPIFYKVEKLNNPKITQPILSLAQANGIPARDVYQINASRDTNRMSANVSGFGRTMRITLNDNLLRRGSPEEIQGVMGHEMGHYVLNHIPKSIQFFLIVIVATFALLKWSLEAAINRWGQAWDVRAVGDTAVLPLVMLFSSIFGLVMTPVFNTFTRTQEFEADMYGINASRQPDGFAQAAIHLGEYRKMSPGPIEEYIFFDHPSGRNRIFAAMQWKSQNLQLFLPAAAAQGNPPAFAAAPASEKTGR